MERTLASSGSAASKPSTNARVCEAAQKVGDALVGCEQRHALEEVGRTEVVRGLEAAARSARPRCSAGRDTRQSGGVHERRRFGRLAVDELRTQFRRDVDGADGFPAYASADAVAPFEHDHAYRAFGQPQCCG
jgi:hypothetical protein